MPRSNPFKITSAYIEFLHDRGIEISWPGVQPVGPRDCIDMNLLESSAEQPFQGGFGVEFYPTIYDKAACLFFSIAGGHLFTNGNKRTAVLALDQFLLGNAVYLALSNEEIKVLAEETASYGERGENQANVRQMLSTEIKRGSVPFSGIRPSDPKFYRRMHKLKNLIRSHRLNQAGVRPQQAIFENRY